MTMADRYRAAFKKAEKMETVQDFLTMLEAVDPDAQLATRDLGVYIEFSDGSIWRMGASDEPATIMRA